MPSDLMFKVSNAAHRSLQRVTGGRAGWRLARMPVLRLTTIGRRTGQPRTVMLTAPHQMDDVLVVVASKGGADGHPAWFLNLREHPEVEVETRSQPKHERRARIATAEERARLWPLIVEQHTNYAGYQNKTDREIPLVLLETVG